MLCLRSPKSKCSFQNKNVLIFIGSIRLEETLCTKFLQYHCYDKLLVEQFVLFPFLFVTIEMGSWFPCGTADYLAFRLIYVKVGSIFRAGGEYRA